MTTQPIFARYLYLKSGVLESLENAILKRDYKESLFWAYEIYYSGFEEEIFEYLFWIMERMDEKYEKLMKFLKKMEKEWKTNNSEYILATMIKNICLRKLKQMFIIVKKEDIDSLRENHPITWKTLEEVCVYAGIKRENEESLKLLSNWLFYASFSPIWRNRISENNGKIDNKKIVFDTDDDLENFYDKYNYEPEEQSIETQKRCIFSI
jgi:hypothetical protein